VCLDLDQFNPRLRIELPQALGYPVRLPASKAAATGANANRTVSVGWGCHEILS
jgi:hypothetical protein